MDKFEGAKEELINRLCRTIAKTSLIDMAKTIHELPINDAQKQSILLTILSIMLRDTLNSFYEDTMSSEDLLKKKLEFLRIIRGTYIEEHRRRQKKEKRNDNG